MNRQQVLEKSLEFIPSLETIEEVDETDEMSPEEKTEILEMTDKSAVEMVKEVSPKPNVYNEWNPDTSQIIQDILDMTTGFDNWDVEKFDFDPPVSIFVGDKSLSL